MAHEGKSDGSANPRDFVQLQWFFYSAGLVIVALWQWIGLITDLDFEGFSAGATLILAFLVLRDSHLARELAVTSLERTFSENQALQRKATQPVVTCVLERMDDDIHIEVRNSGLTPARNIVITLDDELLMETLEDT